MFKQFSIRNLFIYDGIKHLLLKKKNCSVIMLNVFVDFGFIKLMIIHHTSSNHVIMRSPFLINLHSGVDFGDDIYRY